MPTAEQAERHLPNGRGHATAIKRPSSTVLWGRGSGGARHPSRRQRRRGAVARGAAAVGRTMLVRSRFAFAATSVFRMPRWSSPTATISAVLPLYSNMWVRGAWTCMRGQGGSGASGGDCARRGARGAAAATAARRRPRAPRRAAVSVTRRGDETRAARRADGAAPRRERGPTSSDRHERQGDVAVVLARSRFQGALSLEWRFPEKNASRPRDRKKNDRVPPFSGAVRFRRCRAPSLSSAAAAAAAWHGGVGHVAHVQRARGGDGTHVAGDVDASICCEERLCNVEAVVLRYAHHRRHPVLQQNNMQ